MATVDNSWIEFDAQDSVAYREEEQDLSPGDNQALLRAEYSVISPGTELSTLHGTILPPPEMQGKPPSYPAQPGYCMVGTVVESSDKQAVRPGDRVMAKVTHCRYSLFDTTKTSHWCRVPESLPSDAAALGSLAHIALTAPMIVGLRADHRVLVVGLGMIGYLSAQWFKVLGAGEVHACDLSEDRVQFAEQHGVVSFTPSGINEQVKERLYDIVVEATGSPKALEQVFAWVKRGGGVALLGTTRGKVKEFDFTNHVHRKALTMWGAHAGRHGRRTSVGTDLSDKNTLAMTLNHMAAGKINVEGLIGRTFRPKQAKEAYAAADSGEFYTVGFDWA